MQLSLYNLFFYCSISQKVSLRRADFRRLASRASTHGTTPARHYPQKFPKTVTTPSGGSAGHGATLHHWGQPSVALHVSNIWSGGITFITLSPAVTHYQLGGRDNMLTL